MSKRIFIVQIILMASRNFRRKLCQVIVEEGYVKSDLDHLTNLENLKNIRKRKRQDDQKERQRKDVSSYDWKCLVENGKPCHSYST